MYVLDDPVDYDLDSQPLAGRRGPAGRRRSRAEYAYDVQLQRGGRQLIYTPDVQLRPRQPRRRPRDDHLAGGHVRPVRCRCPLRPDLRREHDHQPTSPCGPATAGTTTGCPSRRWCTRSPSARPPISAGSTGAWWPRATWPISTSSTSTGSECAPPEITADLPAGGRRLLQAATGYRWTLKRGDGDLRGRRPYRRAARGAGPGRPTRTADEGREVDVRPTSWRPSSTTPAPGPTARPSRIWTGT